MRDFSDIPRIALTRQRFSFQERFDGHIDWQGKNTSAGRFLPCQAPDGLFGLPHHESGNDAVYPCGSEAWIHLHGLFRDYGRYRRLEQKPGFQAGGRGPVSESRHIRCCFLYRSSYYLDQLLFRIRFEKHRSMNCKPSSRHKPAQSSISGNSIKVGMPISINLYHLVIVIG